jgi:transcriptional regulator with XRE-family HTH domain
MLRAARKQHAVTRRDVASRIGISAGDLRRYEQGDAPAPSSVIASLAECYGEDLTAQFASRAPVHIEAGHVAVGSVDVAVPSADADEVLGTYIGIISRLRQSEPGEPIALRTADLVALSSALGQDPAHIEARIVELLGCTPREARSLHAELLRRKLVLPVAGLVAGLAVVAGIGVAAAAPGSSASTPAAPPAATAGPPPSVAANQTPPTTTIVHVPKAEPTTTIAAQTAAPATPAATPATTPAPAAPAATPAAPAATTQAAQPAAVPRPVITPDSTPMSIPPNETVTIIQP